MLALVGMTFFKPLRATLDLATGTCTWTALGDEAHQMPTNKKGHFMVDVVGQANSAERSALCRYAWHRLLSS